MVKNWKTLNLKRTEWKHCALFCCPQVNSIAMSDTQKLSAERTTKLALKSLQHAVFYQTPAKDSLLKTL